MWLDDFLPEYHFKEVHSITIHAPADNVYRAIKNVTPAEMPLVRTLFVMRSWPAVLTHKVGASLRVSRPLLEQMLDTGFVKLKEETDRELVLGTVGQFWKITGQSFKLATVEEFLTFDRPNYAKAAINFTISKGPQYGDVTVRTETRVYVSDRASRRKFALYWVPIRFGSGLIRRMWLRAIKRVAEDT